MATAPKWMLDVADSMVPDISGRKKAAAEAAAEKAQKDQAAKEAAAAAEREKAKKKVDSIQFKKGGRVTGYRGYGKAKKV